MEREEDVVMELEPVIPIEGDNFDLIIIGAGPAGMEAAVCAGRARLKTLVIDRALPGGQASTSYKIYNYLGYPNGVMGDDLALKMEKHFREYKIQYTCENVEDILNISEKEKIIKTDLGSTYKTKAIILAVGLEPKQMQYPFEKQFLGRGISYYAQCDAESYKNETVAVIGGGNCACYAAEYLAQFVKKLYIIHRSDYIKAVKTLKEKIMNNSIIDVLWNTELVDVFGVDHVEKIKLLNISTTQTTWLDVKAIFVYVGRIPPRDLISVDIELDEKGYIITDEYMRTNIPGVYAAGDIRSKQIRQIATAISDGMIAAINVDRDIIQK